MAANEASPCAPGLGFLMPWLARKRCSQSICSGGARTWGLPTVLPRVPSQGVKDSGHFWCGTGRDAVAEPRGRFVARGSKQALRTGG